MHIMSTIFYLLYFCVINIQSVVFYKFEYVKPATRYALSRTILFGSLKCEAQNREFALSGWPTREVTQTKGGPISSETGPPGSAFDRYRPAGARSSG